VSLLIRKTALVTTVCSFCCQNHQGKGLSSTPQVARKQSTPGSCTTHRHVGL